MVMWWCHTKKQQTVRLAEEPLADVSIGKDRVRTCKLCQQTTHLQLEALSLTWTCYLWDKNTKYERM